MKISKSLKTRDLSFRFASASRPCLGLVVSKKYGDAVHRNLFKRHCRSLFKTFIIDNEMLCAIVVRPNRKNISYKSINESFAYLYNQLLS